MLREQGAERSFARRTTQAARTCPAGPMASNRRAGKLPVLPGFSWQQRIAHGRRRSAPKTRAPGGALVTVRTITAAPAGGRAPGGEGQRHNGGSRESIGARGRCCPCERHRQRSLQRSPGPPLCMAGRRSYSAPCGRPPRRRGSSVPGGPATADPSPARKRARRARRPAEPSGEGRRDASVPPPVDPGRAGRVGQRGTGAKGGVRKDGRMEVRTNGGGVGRTVLKEGPGRRDGGWVTLGV